MEKENKGSSIEKRSRSGSERRKRRSRSRSRKRYQRSVSRSRSPSPFRRNRGRFGRRSPPYRGGRGFRGRGFRRSRSLSRGRYERKDRRFESRRSRSITPQDRMDYNQQQQQMNYPADPYNNYMAVVPPQAPSFAPMNQFNSYEFQGNYAPPAPNFSNIACPAPPGMSDSWIPQQAMAPTMPPEESEEDRRKREAAIAEEKKRQREGLKMQRDQYIRRAEKMRGELKVLKDQKADLLDGLGKRSPSPKTNGFIKENEKLQLEISMKLSEILNVIDMLSGIIGKDEEEPPKKKSIKRSKKSESDDSSPERIKTELLESMKRKKMEAEEKKEKVNYVYYDNELHWCKHCQVFPKTAKDYLNHLHTKEHLDKISNRSTEGPWRSSFQKSNEVPNYPDAPTEKVPIKGLQFFEPATAWFCKLCEMFMGDSWCVSLHLKSEIHSQRYNKLIEREPKFEEKWLEARNKAFELSELGIDSTINSNEKGSSDSKKLIDKKSKKKKNKRDSKKKRKHGKKRKRNSSSSSSDSEDNSESSSQSENSSKKNDSDQNDAKNSIRVAMRNISAKTSSANENDDRTGKWTMVPIDANKPLAPPAPTISTNAAKEIKKDEQIIGQWSTVEPIISQEEKRLLENLKGRLKTQPKPELAEEKPIEKKDSFKDKARSRSRDRNRGDRNYRSRRSRTRSRSKSRRRSRSRSRSRRRSRSLSNSRRNRRRYSRSRSRSRGRYEKSNIKFSNEPKLPPIKDEKKLPSRSYSSSKKDELSSSSSSSSLAKASKKMPFIGKMPVFKKQLVEKKSDDTSQSEKKEEPLDNNKQDQTTKMRDDRNEKWDELMPDPLQFSAMMNSVAVQQQQLQAEVEEEIDAPPGLDAVLDYEDIPKPISDAPPLKTGPLPADFQTTLDLLFDGDKPKKAVIEPQPVEIPQQQQEPMPIIPPIDGGPQMILPEELSQHALLYGNYFQQGNNVQPVPPPPVINDVPKEVVTGEAESDKNDSTEMIVESTENGKGQEDLEDLAMLGIDVNDVGSGLW